MKWNKNLTILFILAFLTGLTIDCGFFRKQAEGSNETRPAGSPNSSGSPEVSRSSPIEQNPDPITFDGMDLRDAVRAFKKMLGSEISLSKIVVEKDAVTISVYDGNNSGDFRYTATGVTKLSTSNGAAQVKFVKAFSNISPVEKFDLDDVPLTTLPHIADTAPKMTWIDSGKVEKIEIVNSPSSWTVTVGGTQNQIVYHLNVKRDSFGVYEDSYLRPYAGYLIEPLALQEKVAEIKDELGGKLRLLSFRISAGNISLIAQDIHKPDEFNDFTYFKEGNKWEKPVSESTLKSPVMAKERNVRSIEDSIFNVDDLDLNLVSEMATATLNKLRLEKSSVNGVEIGSTPDFVNRTDLKWRVSVTADNGRRRGFAVFDLQGHLLESKQD